MEIYNNQQLEDLIIDVPDFPKKGIIFKDITPLLAEASAIKSVANQMAQPFIKKRIDYIVGLEARGFIVGALVAHVLNVGFIPIRKTGKLPRATIKTTYELEYGSEILEIHKESFNKNKTNILIVDDVLATGGTAQAAADLVKKCGGKIVGFSFLIEIKKLQGRETLQDDTIKSVFIF